MEPALYNQIKALRAKMEQGLLTESQFAAERSLLVDAATGTHYSDGEGDDDVNIDDLHDDLDDDMNEVAQEQPLDDAPRDLYRGFSGGSRILTEVWRETGSTPSSTELAQSQSLIAEPAKEAGPGALAPEPSGHLHRTRTERKKREKDEKKRTLRKADSKDGRTLELLKKRTLTRRKTTEEGGTSLPSKIMKVEEQGRP